MRHLAIFTACVLGLSSGPLAAEKPPTIYRLQATLNDGPAMVGQPVLRVEAGRRATIEIGNGDGHYLLTMTAAPQASGLVRVSWDIDAKSPTYGHRAARPVLDVLPGKSAEIAFGEDSATRKPFHVTFVIDPVSG